MKVWKLEAQGTKYKKARKECKQKDFTLDPTLKTQCPKP